MPRILFIWQILCIGVYLTECSSYIGHAHIHDTYMTNTHDTYMACTRCVCVYLVPNLYFSMLHNLRDAQNTFAFMTPFI